MNPKCPWCGTKMSAFVFSKGWSARCKNLDCPEKLYYATPDKALAAASKRFMPKRSVEEIMRGTNKFRDMYADQFNKCVRHESGKVPCEYDDYLEAVMYTRIADYMTGVTE